jgi:1,6-anhydro-N-acetylmuramate kinase
MHMYSPVTPEVFSHLAPLVGEGNLSTRQSDADRKERKKALLAMRIDEVIVSGGGARNTTLLAMLAQCLSPAHVTISDEYGLGIEAKEAVAFAVLAYETWHKRLGNIPAATGAARAVVLGSLTY